ncbi:MAG: hypothetical protein H8E15_05350 [Planctomycetes bacterium]|nr:hypothetical protein [Planctomycetota bacterium]
MAKNSKVSKLDQAIRTAAKAVLVLTVSSLSAYALERILLAVPGVEVAEMFTPVISGILAAMVALGFVWRAQCLKLESDIYHQMDRATYLTEDLKSSQQECRNATSVTQNLEKTVASLQVELAEKEKEIRTLNAALDESEHNDLVEQVRTYQSTLEEGREEFYQLMDSIQPAVAKYGEFIQEGEAGHERIKDLLRSLDRSLSILGEVDDDFSVKVQIPEDPHEFFGVDSAASPSEDIKSAYRRMVKGFHPDKVTHWRIPWLIALCDAITAKANLVYEATKKKEAT